MMTTAKATRRPPKSIRKHIRTQKALMRRTLPEKEATRAIEQLLRRLRHDAASSTAQAKPAGGVK